MTEARSNNWPLNQAALGWLEQAKAEVQPDQSYLAQLAAWGLESGQAEVPRPQSPSQPLRSDLQQTVEALLGQDPLEATVWFLQNPNLPQEDQRRTVADLLKAATSPQEAAQSVVETAYDRMVAESESSPA